MVKNVKVGGAPVQTFAEWHALPEISFSTLRSDSDAGSIYAVRKIGWLLADRQDCREGRNPGVGDGGGESDAPHSRNYVRR